MPERRRKLNKGMGQKRSNLQGENDAQPKIRCVWFELCTDVRLFNAVADATARQCSTFHLGLNRSIFDGPRYGDCDGPQCRPELGFEWGQGAGPRKAWL